MTKEAYVIEVGKHVGSYALHEIYEDEVFYVGYSVGDHPVAEVLLKKLDLKIIGRGEFGERVRKCHYRYSVPNGPRDSFERQGWRLGELYNLALVYAIAHFAEKSTHFIVYMELALENARLRGVDEMQTKLRLMLGMKS